MSLFMQVGSSPVAQDFIWLGEYLDGTHLSEFDLREGEENNFYRLEKERLVRFGLVGQGLKLYFETDGIFYLGGHEVQMFYEVGGKEYRLNGTFMHNYRDVITYKDAEAFSTIVRGGPSEGVFGTRILQYNFGYKAKLEYPDVTFRFQPIVKIPMTGHDVYISIKLVADKDLDGKLIIRRNGITKFEYHAPIKANVGGEINWTLQ